MSLLFDNVLEFYVVFQGCPVRSGRWDVVDWDVDGFCVDREVAVNLTFFFNYFCSLGGYVFSRLSAIYWRGVCGTRVVDSSEC